VSVKYSYLIFILSVNQVFCQSQNYTAQSFSWPVPAPLLLLLRFYRGKSGFRPLLCKFSVYIRTRVKNSLKANVVTDNITLVVAENVKKSLVTE
jgi:hypothetical protein